LPFPLVSVIIPLYNAEKYISETINSVINQSYNNWEIIIVNDGSTDNSLCIAQSFESEKVKIISVNNGGASRARNIGLDNSKGEFIQYLDSDDLLSTDKIENQVRLLVNDNADLVFCKSFIFNNSEDISNYKNSDIECYENFRFNGSGKDLLLKMFTGHNVQMIPIHSILFKKEIAIKVGLWNELITLDDDGEYFIRVYCNCEKVVFDNHSLCFYRRTSIFSLSKTEGKGALKSEYISLISKENTLQHFLFRDDFKKVIQNLMTLFLYKYYLKYKNEYEVISIIEKIKMYDNFNIILWPKRVSKYLHFFFGYQFVFTLKGLLNQKFN
jgi:glycosyltransferase involved in cell wall biosynthesis